ncbi:MAG: ATP-binding cassette domain-containing protein, partial [Clostridia bacterium]|nr:ATP-binding cassette domain-containing protein [Clostridia bacterium]
MRLIACKDAAFAYEGHTVVSGLNFTVNSGDYLCVVGENGSGKSTLMKGLLRLKSPSAGSVEFADGLRASEIGYLPQQTAAQKDFPASVYEVVL